MNNRDFLINDRLFGNCCISAGIEATKRQVSKFRNGKGLAFSFKAKVIANMNKAKKEGDV